MNSHRPNTDIFINDVTLRDGEQAPGNTMSTSEKLVIARQLVRLGVNGIEAGFAIASPGDFEAVQAIATDIGPIILERPSPYGNQPRISSLARLNQKDVESAMDAIAPAPNRGVHVFISTSKIQSVKFAETIRNRGGNPESMRDFIDKVVTPGIEESMDIIKSRDPNATIQFSPEDWTRTEEDVSDEVIIAAATNGATVINLPDTVGAGIPRIITKRVAHVRELLGRHGFEHVIISWHGHNDTGQGVANAMEALYAGARQFETTILGIGERTGNFSFEGFLAALDANKPQHEEIIGMEIRDAIVRKETMNTAKLVAAMISIQIPREHPIVGENAFAHESGIHQHGVMAGRESGAMVYEVLKPEDYGTKSRLILGKHSGWAGLKNFFTENGLPFDEKDRQRFADALSRAADGRRKGLSDEEVLKEVYYPQVISILGGAEIKSILDVHPINNKHTVTISCQNHDPIYGTASAEGEGRIDAIIQGMKKMIPGVDVSRSGFKVQMIGEGGGARARATVTLQNAYSVTETAEDIDTDRAIEAALMKAFNALCALEAYSDLASQDQ